MRKDTQISIQSLVILFLSVAILLLLIKEIVPNFR